MVEALCDVGLFRHALHILREAAPAEMGERKRLYVSLSPTHPPTHPPTHLFIHSLTYSSTHPPTHPPTHLYSYGMVMSAASSGGDHDLVFSISTPHSPTHPPTHPPRYGMVMSAASSGGDHDLVFSLHDEILTHMGPGPAANRDVYQAVLQSLRAVGLLTGPGLNVRGGGGGGGGGGGEEHSPEARWQRLVAEMLQACAGGGGGGGESSASATKEGGGKRVGGGGGRGEPILRGGNEVLAACVAAREWELGTRALIGTYVNLPTTHPPTHLLPKPPLYSIFHLSNRPLPY